MNILFSSCGRRAELISLFRRALNDIGKRKARLIAVDNNLLASAAYIADAFYKVPKLDEEDFIEEIIRICKSENVTMIIPLIDPELSIYAAYKGVFGEQGIRTVVSDTNVVDICNSKLKTEEFYNRLNIPCIRTMPVEVFLANKIFSFPVIIKPNAGSGSKNVYEAMDENDIKALIKRIADPVVQPKIEGQEITIDCLCDFEGHPINAVSRLRIETRAGESSKGKTFKDKVLLDYTYWILKDLKPIGPVTIQCFKVNNGYLFSEINPRFGGGYPLSHAAGANYPKLLLKMHMGEKINGLWGEYQEDVYFTRYDQSFFFKGKGRGEDLGLERFNGYEVSF